MAAMAGKAASAVLGFSGAAGAAGAAAGTGMAVKAMAAAGAGAVAVAGTVAAISPALQNAAFVHKKVKEVEEVRNIHGNLKEEKEDPKVPGTIDNAIQKVAEGMTQRCEAFKDSFGVAKDRTKSADGATKTLAPKAEELSKFENSESV